LQVALLPGPVDGFFEDLCFEQLLFVAINHTEGRVQGEFVKILRYKPFAKRMYRTDIGALEQHKLVAKMAVRLFQKRIP